MDIQNRVNLIQFQIVRVLREQTFMAIVVEIKGRKVVQFSPFQNTVYNGHPNRKIRSSGSVEENLPVTKGEFTLRFLLCRL